MSKVIGIDVSKASFDVAFLKNDEWVYLKLSNDRKGFKHLLSHLQQEDHCTMEASGPYYLQLAIFLDENGIKVSVVNPLVIKRFSQMRLIRAKTDKKDARVIAEYAAKENPSRWKKTAVVTLKMQQIMSSLDLIQKHKTAIRNQKEAFNSSGIVDDQVSKTLKGLLSKLKKEEIKLENRLEEHIEGSYSQTFKRLTGIPCIGKKAATMLIALTDDFQKFDNYKQLIAYVGFSPRIYQSGTSIKGKGHICKMGKSQIRKILYLCSWTAKRYNRPCKEMYDRLKEKGKPEKVIKIAIANKLLKLAFAIGKSKSNYNENYISKPCF